VELARERVFATERLHDAHAFETLCNVLRFVEIVSRTIEYALVSTPAGTTGCPK